MLAHQASSEEEDEEWSDAAFAEENKITGLRVQMDTNDWICYIQARCVR